MRAPIPHWPGEELTLGDRTVFVRTAPARAEAAEPAVFVHGLAGAASNWTDLMDELAADVAGAAIDLPGFGVLISFRYGVGAGAPPSRATRRSLASR